VFWTLERAAMELETPASYRSTEGRETLEYLNAVRAAFAHQDRIPGPPSVARSRMENAP
jgi:hypothetical protein